MHDVRWGDTRVHRPAIYMKHRCLMHQYKDYLIAYQYLIADEKLSYIDIALHTWASHRMRITVMTQTVSPCY